MKKNIIFILIDSMCEEDLIFINNNIDNFEGFKKIINSNKSQIFSNAYAVSTPTEPTMPSLFTGQLPLDKKTYEYGIKYFRKDFFKVIKDNNYDFKVLSNHSVISKMMGYTNNLVNIKLFNSIEHQWKYFQRVYCWSYLNNKKYEKYRVKAFKNKFKQFMNFFYCHLDRDKSWFSKSVNSLSENKTSRIKNKIKIKLLQLKNVNKNNIEEFLNEIIKNDFFTYFNESTIKDRLLRYVSRLFVDKNFTWKYSKINILNYQIRFRNLVTNADKMLDATIDSIKDNKNKFFIMTHIMDLHHLNFSNNNLILKKPRRKIHEFKHKYGTDRELSLIYLDKQIKLFLGKLPDSIKQNSCIAISSDHGTAADEFEKGPLTSNRLCGLFSECFLKIPLIVYNGNKNKLPDTDHLINNRNIFPILFASANMKLNSYAKELSNIKKQNYILAEHTHRGPAYDNLNNSQVYNCIITKKYKYILKSKISSFDPIKNHEILINYPNENINVLNNSNSLFVSKLKKIVNKRQEELLLC